MMKIGLAAIVCFISFISVDCADRQDAGERANLVMPDRRSVYFEESRQERSEINVNGKNRKNLHDILNANSHYDFKVVRTVKIANGKTKQRIEVTFDGIPVFGLSIQATYDEKNGYTGALTGEFVSGIENDISDSSSCQRNENFLLSLGKKKSGLPAVCPHCSLTRSQKYIYFDNKNKAHLAYVIEIENDAPEKFSRYYLIVDACTLGTYEMKNTTPNRKQSVSSIHEADITKEERRSNINKRQNCPVSARGTGGNPKIGPIHYGTWPFCLDVTRRGRRCILENANVKVTDMKHRNTGGRVYRYNCRRARDSINGANSANLDAFFYGNVMTRVFQNNYHMNPLPYQISLKTHWGNNYNNAFWDGRAREAVFGDDNNYVYTWVSLDIVAHEVAHGMTDQYSNLVYADESGGINEAFSDITGEMVEAFSGYRTTDWMAGYDITKRQNSAIRYFWNPPKDGVSISHVDDYNNGMDVHYSSGIYNKAFYEMVVTQRIPMRLAYHMILLANQMYWNANSNFQQAACGVRNAAIDLGISTSKVDAAFSVVGINTARCGGGNNGYNTLYPGRLTFNVSPSVNPCFLLQPRSASWYYIYVIANTRNGNHVLMTIKNGVTMQTIGARYDRLAYYLPSNGQDRLICFSASRPTTVYLRTYYCGFNGCVN